VNDICATEFQTVADGVFVWSCYSEQNKVELTSTAVLHKGYIYVFDPIPLAGGPMRELESMGRPWIIILTNENHARATLDFKRRWQTSVITDVRCDVDVPDIQRFAKNQERWEDWTLIKLTGAVRGELAFYLKPRNLLIIGDALFNLPDKGGFQILPDRYCEDPATLQRSLRQLVDLNVKCLVMAHGQPITDQPRQRLRELLGPAKK
jgi:glyoxylase-like metal-dependent hydrolase (beta-lactamase superfamily II)